MHYFQPSIFQFSSSFSFVEPTTVKETKRFRLVRDERLGFRILILLCGLDTVVTIEKYINQV